MIQPFNVATNATKIDNDTENLRSRASRKGAGREHKKMRDGKRGGLLRKGEREFPNENDGRVYENGKRSVLKFAGEIAADPRVRTEQRQVAFAPAARDVGEDGQDRQLIIVIPEKKRVVPEKEEAEGDDYGSGEGSAKELRTRGARLGHLRKKTSNAQRPTLNAQLSALGVGR